MVLGNHNYMKYEYLVKINNQNKKNLENFILNNDNYSKKVKNVFWDKNNAKKINTYLLFCKCLLEVDLNNWNVHNLVNIEGMFCDCISLENLRIDKWNTPNLRDMSYFIDNCNKLRKINLGFLKKADHIYVQQILKGIKKSNKGLKIEGL